MPNVGQLSLISAWNSFAINTVELKQRTTKRKTKTERNATALHIRFFETKRDKTFASYHIVPHLPNSSIANETHKEKSGGGGGVWWNFASLQGERVCSYTYPLAERNAKQLGSNYPSYIHISNKPFSILYGSLL